MNFAEQIELLKNKSNYWKGKGLPLFSRVKVVNIFLLSRLWYRTNVWDISKTHLDTLNCMVRNFIWEEKRGARVRQDVLQLQYEFGGMQLVDISCKTQVQRVRRILYLMSLDSNHFERFLADELVGSYARHRQNGLSFGLFNNSLRIQQIQNDYYKNAFKIICSLGIQLRPTSLNNIQNEPLFYNKLFINQSTDEVFKLTRYKNQMPRNLSDLNSFPHSREQEINNTVSLLRRCLQTLGFTQDEHNEFYMVSQNDTDVKITDSTFKDLYLILLNKKLINREWENRWLNYLALSEIDWHPIWSRVHSDFNNNYVKSAIWESFHLNFWSNFRAKENCCLCREV